MRHTPPKLSTISSMHSETPGAFSSFCTNLVLFMTHSLFKLPETSDTPDFAMTVPFELGKLSPFSILRARILWRTIFRWSWFEKARKDDEEANTRLGSLRYLPYEIRQQIFKFVLADYYEQYNRRGRRLHIASTYSCAGNLFTCEQENECETSGVFELRSYSRSGTKMERAPLGLRSVSPSIRLECEYILLTSNNFVSTCPASIRRFLDQLSPLQQGQLRSLRIHLFGCSNCCRDRVELCNLWVAFCQRLPTGLTSVEFGWTDLGGRRWRPRMEDGSFRRLSEAEKFGLAAGMFGVLSKQVWRASSRAKLSMTGRERLYKGECDVLDAALEELEPWSKEWHEWKDGVSRLVGLED